MRAEAPTFEGLEQEIRREAHNDSQRGSRRERVALVVFVLGFTTALVALWLPTTTLTAWAALVGIVAELLAGGVYAFLALRRSFTSLETAKLDFARDLDRDYPGYLHVLAWLRGFPKNDIRERLDYLRMRQTSMTRRVGLLIGSAERLGALPIAVALYLQFRSFTWPLSYTAMEAAAAFALVLFYATSYWIMATKLRLDLYVNLLEASLAKVP